MNPMLAHVSDYLMDAECREPDIWHQQDYRVASVMVGQVEQGETPCYDRVFTQLFGKWPKGVTWWWRDREKLLFLSEYCNRATPLMLANYTEELLLSEWIEIPDHGWVPKAAAKPFLILKRQEVRREYQAEWHRENRAERKLQNVCIECAQPAVEGHTRCERHRVSNQQATARHAKRRAAQGICRNCSLPVCEGSKYFCESHRETVRAANRACMQRRRAQKAISEAA